MNKTTKNTRSDFMNLIFFKMKLENKIQFTGLNFSVTEKRKNINTKLITNINT